MPKFSFRVLFHPLSRHHEAKLQTPADQADDHPLGQEFQTEIEKHLAQDPLLNDTWLVSTWEHAFELHGLNLHGRIQGYHFRIPNLKVEAVVTFEFRKGDEALVKHLVKLLSSPSDVKVHTKPLLGQQNQNSESELAEFLNNYKSTSP